MTSCPMNTEFVMTEGNIHPTRVTFAGRDYACVQVPVPADLDDRIFDAVFDYAEAYERGEAKPEDVERVIRRIKALFGVGE